MTNSIEEDSGSLPQPQQHEKCVLGLLQRPRAPGGGKYKTCMAGGLLSKWK